MEEKDADLITTDNTDFTKLIYDGQIWVMSLTKRINDRDDSGSYCATPSTISKKLETLDCFILLLLALYDTKTEAVESVQNGTHTI